MMNLLASLLLLGPASAAMAPVDSNAATEKRKNMTVEQSNEQGGKPVAGLPYARGRSFVSLDEYLAHLQANGAIDLPWWKEIRPGVYQHVKRMTGSDQEVATRDELKKKFGFSR